MLANQNEATAEQEKLVPLKLEVNCAHTRYQVSYIFNLTQKTNNDIYARLKNGIYHEPETTNALLQILQPGDVFIDIGAHIGYFSMLAAQVVGPQGHVVSVEPDDTNYFHLTEHARLNGLQNITTCQHALSNAIAETRFFTNPRSDGAHALWNVTAHEQTQTGNADLEAKAKTVCTETLDHLLESVSLAGRTIKMMKIDAEGAETDVIEGARQTIAAHAIPFIVAEISPFALEQMGSTPDALRRRMHDLGYETFVMHPKGLLPKLIPDGVAIASDTIFNVLFARLDRVRDVWSQESLRWDQAQQIHAWG